MDKRIGYLQTSDGIRPHAMSAMPPIATEFFGAAKRPYLPKSGIGGASRLRPSHTTVRTGPYTAVRKVELTRFEQGWETERFEVSIGEPHREGFAPDDVPRATTAAGRVARKLPRDSQCDQCRSATPWCFPLAPESRP